MDNSMEMGIGGAPPVSLDSSAGIKELLYGSHTMKNSYNIFNLNFCGDNEEFLKASQNLFGPK